MPNSVIDYDARYTVLVVEIKASDYHGKGSIAISIRVTPDNAIPLFL